MSCCSFHGCGDCEAAAIPYSSLAERHNMWLNAQSLHRVTLVVDEFETVFGVDEDTCIKSMCGEESPQPVETIAMG